MTTGRARLTVHSLWNFVRTDVSSAVIALLALLAVWEIVGFFVVPRWLPRLALVLSEAGTLLSDGRFMGVLGTSVGETLLGFAIGTVLGATAGVAVVRSQKANMALRLYIVAILTVPSVVVAPILLVIFGVSQVNIVILVVIFVIGLVAITTTAAVRSLDQALVDMASVYGCRPLRMIWMVVLPFIMPTFMSGAHLGMARGFKGMIVGQVFVGVIGLGAYETRFEQAFTAVGMWSIALILIATALVFVWILRGLDHVLSYWAYQ